MLITLTQLKKSLQALKDFLLAKITVKDVQVNGASILDEGVADIPVGGLNKLGLVSYDNQYGNNGIVITSSGAIRTNVATDSQIKLGVNGYCPIPPTKQHAAAFYGLATASGDTTQSASSNAVGTYTDDAKTSIKAMLGVEDPVDVQINGTSIVDNGVANIPVMSKSTFGVAKAVAENNGITIDLGGALRIEPAQSSEIKKATGNGSLYKPINTYRQHEAVFYGLAKVAGHDEKDSTLAVGTYTDEAKAAIKTMLGIDTITVDSIPTTEIDALFA